MHRAWQIIRRVLRGGYGKVSGATTGVAQQALFLDVELQDESAHVADGTACR